MKKICLVSASGGHFEQLTRLKPLLTMYSGFIVTEKTDFSVQSDYFVTKSGTKDKWKVIKTIRLFFEAFKILRKEKPDYIITTGTFVSLPFMIWSKIHKKKFIYIETFARVKDTTKAGRFMYKHADLFIYQWESLKEAYPNGVYGGSIY